MKQNQRFLLSLKLKSKNHFLCENSRQEYAHDRRTRFQEYLPGLATGFFMILINAQRAYKRDSLLLSLADLQWVKQVWYYQQHKMQL